MKPPKTIDVFGKTIDVKIIAGLCDDDGVIIEGRFTPNKGLIELDGNHCEMQCLLHEAFHSVIHRVGLKQSDLSDELEEVIVDNLATFMVETFNLRFKRKK